MARFRAVLVMRADVLDALPAQLAALMRDDPAAVEFEAESIGEARAVFNRAWDTELGTWTVTELAAAPGSARPELN